MTNIDLLNLKKEIEDSIYEEGYFGLDGTKSQNEWTTFGRGEELNIFLDELDRSQLSELQSWWKEESYTHYTVRGGVYGLEEYINTDQNSKDGSFNRGMIMELVDDVNEQFLKNFETKIKEMGFRGYFDIDDRKTDESLGFEKVS